MDDLETEAENDDTERYILSHDDGNIISATKTLLRKIARCETVTSAQLEAIARALQVFDALPTARPGIAVTVQLVGPTRTFGLHEIHHSWAIEIDDGNIQVSAGGYFYRPSTGGDSFTSLNWCATPGFAVEYGDYFDSIRGIVDDAQPYDQEVRSLDLSEPGFSLSVSVDGEELGEECVDEDDPVDGASNQLSLLETLRPLEEAGAEVGWANRECSAVDSVDLNGVALADADLALLQSLSELHSLDARNSSICDRTLVFISHLESLERLCLRRTAVTDEGLRHLKNLRSLQYLDLTGAQIRGPGLQYITSLSSLRELLVSGFQHRDRWLEMVRRELPNCDVCLMG